MSARQFFTLYCSCVLLIIWGIAIIGTTFGSPFEKWWTFPVMLTYSLAIFLMGIFTGSRIEDKNKHKNDIH